MRKEEIMLDLFRLDGYAMWPTTLFGLLMLMGAVLYIVHPDEHRQQLVTLLVWITVTSGLLGFSSGVVKSCLFIGDVEAEKHFLVIIGLGESLVNVAWALGWVLLGLLLKLIGLVFFKNRTPRPA